MNTVITGSSGFLGKYVHSFFKLNGETVLVPNRVEIKSLNYPKNSIERFIHIAGKAHSLPKTKQEEQEFYAINFDLVRHICQQLENSQNVPRQFVFISSVAVYGLESGINIDETFALLGSTPYARSKIQAEEFLIQWGIENNVQILILRLPLVAGINPPGNLGKMMDAIKNGKYLRIGKGNARKSVVWAQDLAKLIYRGKGASGIYNLTDGYNPSFKELEDLIAKRYGKNHIFSLPLFVVVFLGYIGDFCIFVPFNSKTMVKMTRDLTFDDSKARKDLNWRPQSVLKVLFNE